MTTTTATTPTLVTGTLAPAPIVREYRIARTGTGRLAGLAARLRRQRPTATQYRWERVTAPVNYEESILRAHWAVMRTAR